MADSTKIVRFPRIAAKSQKINARIDFLVKIAIELRKTKDWTQFAQTCPNHKAMGTNCQNRHEVCLINQNPQMFSQICKPTGFAESHATISRLWSNANFCSTWCVAVLFRRIRLRAKRAADPRGFIGAPFGSYRVPIRSCRSPCRVLKAPGGSQRAPLWIPMEAPIGSYRGSLGTAEVPSRRLSPWGAPAPRRPGIGDLGGAAAPPQAPRKVLRPMFFLGRFENEFLAQAKLCF